MFAVRLGFKVRQAIPTSLVILPLLLSATWAHADGILTGNAGLLDANNYAVLFNGTGGHQLSTTNGIINGNVGVASTGTVLLTGTGQINGSLNFSALSNTGQFNNTSSNGAPTAVNYGQSVSSDLTALGTLSSTLAGETGTNISFDNSHQTVDASSGTAVTVNGVTDEVFNVIGPYSETDSDTVTIVGNGDNVVFNFLGGGDVSLGEQINLTGGLTADDVLWNFTGSRNTINLNNNGGTFSGILLLPDDTYTSDSNSNLDGRVFGGGGGGMAIQSGATINMPSPTATAPEPSSLLLLGTGLLGLCGAARRRLAAV